MERVKGTVGEVRRAPTRTPHTLQRITEPCRCLLHHQPSGLRIRGGQNEEAKKRDTHNTTQPPYVCTTHKEMGPRRSVRKSTEVYKNGHINTKEAETEKGPERENLHLAHSFSLCFSNSRAARKRKETKRIRETRFINRVCLRLFLSLVFSLPTTE